MEQSRSQMNSGIYNMFTKQAWIKVQMPIKKKTGTLCVFIK